MSHLFTSDNQNIGASASVLPVNIQCWSSLRLTGLIFLLSKGLSWVFSSTTVQRHKFFDILPTLRSSSHNCTWPLGRPQPWLYRPLSAEQCVLFNTLSKFFIAFLSRSNHLLISWLLSPSMVILKPKKRKSVTASIFWHFFNLAPGGFLAVSPFSLHPLPSPINN